VSSQHNEAMAGPSEPGSPDRPGQDASGADRLATPQPDGVTSSAATGPGASAPLGPGSSDLPAQPPDGVAFGGPLPGSRNPWKEGRNGKTVFRRVAPIALWWVWVIFAIFNVIQVIGPDHDYFSIEFAAGLLAVTGIVYATALRPQVLATPDGLEVRNPVRDHTIRWGAVNGVYLGDAVELSCARPEPRKEKTIYCWALYSGRRSRMKSQQLGVRSWTRSSRTAGASEPSGPDAAQLMAAELGRRSTRAREEGVAPATLESRWAWWPIAFICLPAAALLALLLAK
jgi:hypothetical protein